MKTSTKSCHSVFLTVCMASLLMSLTMNLRAQTWPPVSMNGNGTSATPWEITTPAQLEALALYVNAGNGNSTSGKFYKLMNDIDLSGYANWNPIGNNSVYRFQGTFDGAGFAVQNLKITGTASYRGLFGYTSGATIKNLGIENCNISGSSSYCGGLAGYSITTTINNCYATGNISGTGSIGGLVGENYSSISNSYATCNVNGTGSIIGGLAGRNETSTASIKNCYATGKVNGGSNVGGLVGQNYNGAFIINCYATGNVKGVSRFVGGIAGYNLTNVTIRNCVAANDTVQMTNDAYNINRIAGDNGTFQNNYAFAGMVVLGNGKNANLGTIAHNTQAGASKNLADLTSFDFYDTAGNWNATNLWDIDEIVNATKIWRICDKQNFPSLQWQKNYICKPVILAQAGKNGAITPAGYTNVTSGSTPTFTITPASNFLVDSLWINGVYTPFAPGGGNYTFPAPVTEAQTIKVKFNFDCFCGGDGTQGSPYEICDAASLAKFAAAVNVDNGALTAGKYFILTNNIDLSGITNWTPIGDGVNNNRYFQGNFDGNNKTINKLSVDNNTQAYAGLFGYVSGGTIKNVTIENVDIKARYGTGTTVVCVGAVAGHINVGSRVENCQTTGTLVYNNTTSDPKIGGVVGYVVNSFVDGCGSVCNVSGTHHVGGVVGHSSASSANAAIVSNCWSTGNIIGSQTYIAGVVGRSSSYNIITNCWSTGDVTGNTYVGGIVGNTGASTGSVTYSWSSGKINGNTDVGGIVGYVQNGMVSNCYATGMVSGNTNVGGITGRLSDTNGSVRNCYAAGAVKGTGENIGGIAGNSIANTYVQNCVAANPFITTAAGTTNINRISGTAAGTRNNNYAYSGMLVQSNGNNISITDGLNTQSGASTAIAVLRTFNFYNTTSNWNNVLYWSIDPANNPSKTWKICENFSFPYFQWQDDFVCSPTVIAIAGSNGTITPLGHTALAAGSSQTFTFAPDSYYTVDSLWIDGVYTPASIAAGTYTFNNVNANHDIKVTFKLDNFCGGNGTPASPYQICDVASLTALASFVNAGNGAQTVGKYFELTQNIDLGGITNWTPIGDGVNNTRYFLGNFDGNNKTISNLTVNNNTQVQVGLFGYMVGGTIKNLILEDVNISARFGISTNAVNVGSVAGYIDVNSRVENCQTTGTLVYGGTSSEARIGGVVGYVYNSFLDNCGSACNVSGTSQVGGVTGNAWSTSANTFGVSYCWSTGNVTGTGNYTGGVAGRSSQYNNILHCWSTGSVIGNTYVGGISGNTGANGGAVTYCRSSANVTGNSNVGGLTGTMDISSIVSSCYATGMVSGATNVGGLVGNMSGTNTSLRSSYASGIVKGTGNYVGGLVGTLIASSSIINCVAANPSVSTSQSDAININRITGATVGTRTNNYAYSGMLVQSNGNNVPITNGLNTVSGAGADIAVLKTYNFYNTTSNWSNTLYWSIDPANNPAKTWKICEDFSFPYFQWQNGFACNPTITAIAGGNGTITPEGHISVTAGSNQTFTFAPVNSDYVVDSLWIDGVYTPASIAVGTYTFSSVNENHIIKVSFKLDGFCGGNGTEGSPYEICDDARLVHLANFVNAGKGAQTAGKYFILTDNIDLTGIANWTPIGNNTNTGANAYCFEGNFNGNGKVVKNLNISRSTSNSTGSNTALFGYAYGATIRNLGVENCNVSGYSQVGGLVGYSNNTAINNCYTTGTINGGGTQVGGLVGFNSTSSRITNCYSTCNVTSSSTRVGGLVGITNGGANAAISYCYATGNVKGQNEIGGIVGGAWNVVENCVAANASLIATNTTAVINRIVGSNYGTYRNNYALSGMTVQNGSVNVTITDGLNTVAGVTQTLATLTSFSFYSNTTDKWYQNIAWSITEAKNPAVIWQICDGNTYPFLQWEESPLCFNTLVWTGSNGNDWNNPMNWKKPAGAAGTAPGSTTDVRIPSGLTNYPDLTPGVTNYTQVKMAACNDIWFEHGGEVVRTDSLHYNKAHVELQLATDRWYMTSAPLRYMFPGDYWRDNVCAWEDKLQVYTQLFATENPQQGARVNPTGDWSGPFNNPEIEMPTGFGFAVWLDDETYGGEEFQVDGKHAMWFPKQETSYDIYKRESCDPWKTGVLLTRTQGVKDLNLHHRFIYEEDLPNNNPVLDKSTGDITLTTTLPVEVSESKPGLRPLIVGNPFMSHWDFEAFQTQNSTLINDAYYLLKGANDAAFETYSAATTPDDMLIAPMQSIIVSAKNGVTVTENSLKTNVSQMKQKAQDILKTTIAKPDGLLKIIAEKDGKQNPTYILFNEQTTNSYKDREDSYKLFVGSVTEPVTVYTRSSDDFALDINIFGDLKEIPLGVRTSTTGSINLYFEGIESFVLNRDLFLIDKLTGEQIDLRKTPFYSFEKTTGDLFMDNRLYLSFDGVTNAAEQIHGTTSIFMQGNLLKVTSSDNIKQVQIVDMQGRMIVNESNINNRAYTRNLESNRMYIVKVLTDKDSAVEKVTTNNN